MSFFRCASTFFLSTLPLLWAVDASASTFNLLLESNQDKATNEIFMQNYASFGDVLTDTGSGEYSALNVSAAFSVGGLAYDGKYHVLLESNQDRTTNEVFIQTYDTYVNLIGDVGGGAFSALNVSSSFSVGGLFFDGRYHVLLESNADRTTNEIFIQSYNSFADMISDTGGGAFSTLNVSSAFSVGGVAYDGKYHVLLESNQDRTTNEIFIQSYDTFADMLSDSGSGAFSTLNVSSAFSVRGFTSTYLPPPATVPVPVPLPASFPLLFIAGGSLAFIRLRQ